MIEVLHKSFDLLGIPVSVVRLNTVVNCLVEWCVDDIGRFVCVRDAPGIARGIDDPDFRMLHQQAAMVTPDGLPVVWFGKLRGLDIGRCPGADIMRETLNKGRATGVKHYFYGGVEGVAATLSDMVSSSYPGVQIVGVECPPFRQLTDEESSQVDRRLIESGADIVWVGISTPKQEYFMASRYANHEITFVGVGAAFDFLSGRVRRAPMWMQKVGLEWLHRLISEPRRLWYRYLVLGPKFLFVALWEFFVSRSRPR